MTKPILNAKDNISVKRTVKYVLKIVSCVTSAEMVGVILVDSLAKPFFYSLTKFSQIPPPKNPSLYQLQFTLRYVLNTVIHCQ